MDFSHPAVRQFLSNHVSADSSEKEKAVSLYYAVRDTFRYNPYDITLTESGMKASSTIGQNHGWCISKAILLAACCRASGIWSRLGFADVRNHLSTTRLRSKMQTDIFYWHGYTEILLDGKWVKATPAFNIELCEKYHIRPLEFDGINDSIFHAFDKKGNMHMEYLHDRGSFEDLPLKMISEDFKKYYPAITGRIPGDFEAEVKKETGLS